MHVQPPNNVRHLVSIPEVSLGLKTHFQVSKQRVMVLWLRPPIFSALNHLSSHRCGFESCSRHM